MKKHSFLLISFVMMSAFFVGGCLDTALKPPEMKFAGIRIVDADTFGATLEISIEAYNPNPIQIGIDRYDATLFINEKEIATQSGGGITLEPRGKQMFSVKGYFSFGNILGTTADIFPDLLKGKASLDYRVAGSVTAKAAGITFNSPISSSGKINITTEFTK